MALPGDIETIILTGTYLDLEGNPRSGTVTFAPTTPILVDLDSETILAGEQTEALSSGAFSLVLPCTSGLDPTGWLWEVTENVSGAPQRVYAIALPHSLGSTVDISTLTPVYPVPPPNWALLASQLGVANGAAQLNSGGVLPVAEGGTGSGTTAGALTALGALPLPTGGAYPGGTTEYLRADGTWDVPAGGGGGAVSSVFGRTGAVTAQSGDYTAAQVGADASGSAATAQSNAETYAAGQASTAQSNAETYAASQASTAQSNAETYAASQASTAQSNAETYAASQASTAQSNAETYAASQASTAQSNAETYAAGLVAAAQSNSAYFLRVFAA